MICFFITVSATGLAAAAGHLLSQGRYVETLVFACFAAGNAGLAVMYA